MKRATRADVAKLAQVSLSTVSHVMNGRATELKFSPATIDRVLDAARTLHYIPRGTARAFRYSTSRTIGLFFNEIPHWLAMPVFQTVLLQAIYEATRSGYQVMPVPVPRLAPEEVPDFVARTFSGVEIAGVVCEWFESAAVVGRWLAKAPVPLVWFSTSGVVDEAVGMGSVSIDEEPGVTALLNALDPGDFTPILLTGPGPNRPRYDCARRSFPGVREVAVTGWDVPAGEECWPALADIDRPLLICPNDYVAMGVMSAAIAAGRQVPRDVRLTGFGDQRAAGLAMVGISSVRWPVAELGIDMVAALLGALGGKHAGHDRLKTSACLRTSSGAPRPTPR